MILAALILAKAAAFALAPVFQGHIVVQRGMPVPIWGEGPSGAQVQVSFGRITRRTLIGPSGHWTLDLPNMPASSSGARLQASCEGAPAIALDDVLVGEVWIAAGQSNMEFPLRGMAGGAKEIAGASLANLRLFNRPFAGQYRYANPFSPEEARRMTPKNFFGGTWQVSSPESAASMSAIAFVFGKRLLSELHVPIGIIHMAVGGSPAEAWVPVKELAADPVLRPMARADWLQNLALDEWCRQRGHENLDPLPASELPALPDPKLGPNHPFKPGFLFEAGVRPLAPFAMRGVIWYQGESNALSLRRVLQHEVLFPRLVSSLRGEWGGRRFPFLYCQLSSIGTQGGYQSQFWPEFRDSQRRLALAIPNVGMAVTSDIGSENDVHPRDKASVGERLARVALARVYGRAIASSGPRPLRARRAASGVEVEFDQPVKSPVAGFEVAGADGAFGPASALVRGRAVILNSPIPALGWVRYGWQPFSIGTLQGENGLPASTFEIQVEGGLPMQRLAWSQLPAVPDPEGFAGAFTGVSHGALLVAGGANFPGKRPWEGGTKLWYDKVFALGGPTGDWKQVGRLPRPLGYGVSASWRNRLICVGGSDAGRHYADAFGIEIRDQALQTTPLPPLPVKLANGCGALVGDRLYVAGGQEKPDSTSALNRAFCLDLSAAKAGWKELPPIPGEGRILAAAAAFHGSFWVIGGASLHPDEQGKAARTYLRDAYRFDGRAWSRIADLPAPSVAAPSPAPTSSQGIFLLGGDDGSRAGLDARAHPGFSGKILRYDFASNSWAQAGEMPVGRVTVPTSFWRGAWVIANGEDRPGIRSPEVWSVRIPK